MAPSWDPYPRKPRHQLLQSSISTGCKSRPSSLLWGPRGGFYICRVLGVPTPEIINSMVPENQALISKEFLLRFLDRDHGMMETLYAETTHTSSRLWKCLESSQHPPSSPNMPPASLWVSVLNKGMAQIDREDEVQEFDLSTPKEPEPGARDSFPPL